MTALFYGDLSSEGKVRGTVIKLDKKSDLTNHITNSIALVYEISSKSLPQLLLKRPKALIIEYSRSDLAWRKIFESIPIPTVAGVADVTKYMDSGDEVVVDCENIVVIGKMIGEKFDW